MPENYLPLKLMFCSAAIVTFSIATMADEYVPAPQTTIQSLGTLRRSEAGSSAFSPSAASPSATSPSDETPRPIQAGDIIYITGGVGDEERSALESIKNEYNLQITSASKSGEFVGDTHLAIFDRKKTELLDTSMGPMFYAKLPAGHYIIEAVSGGQTKKQNIEVAPTKPATIHFGW